MTNSTPPDDSRSSATGGIAGGYRFAMWVAICVIVAVTVWLRQRSAPVPVAARHYTTGVGGRDSVNLPDGSVVMLGPKSRLTMLAGYGDGRRAVVVEGEAYFDVRHDGSVPFSVQAGPAVIDDIGTTFAVTGDDSPNVTVTVKSGTVRLYAADGMATGVVLNAGDRGILDAEGRISTEPHGVTADDFAWMRGQLVFHDAPVSRVAAALERWYGVHLRIEDSVLTHQHLTAAFMSQSLDEVLRVIGLALGAHIERRGDTAVVHIARER